jgi:hypothetical protein
MTRFPLRRSAASFALFLSLLLFPPEARAGTFPYWGLSFGTAERAAAHVGVSFGQDIPGAGTEGFAMGSGPVIEATLGMGAGRIGVGRSLLVLTEEKSIRVLADLKAVATRTWDEPRGASHHATYLGVEGGLSVAFVRLTMGVSKRLEDKPSGASALFTWGLGVQVRIGGAKPRD